MNININEYLSTVGSGLVFGDVEENFMLPLSFREEMIFQDPVKPNPETSFNMW